MQEYKIDSNDELEPTPKATTIHRIRRTQDEFRKSCIDSAVVDLFIFISGAFLLSTFAGMFGKTPFFLTLIFGVFYSVDKVIDGYSSAIKSGSGAYEKHVFLDFQKRTWNSNEIYPESDLRSVNRVYKFDQLALVLQTIHNENDSTFTAILLTSWDIESNEFHPTMNLGEIFSNNDSFDSLIETAGEFSLRHGIALFEYSDSGSMRYTQIKSSDRNHMLCQ